MNKKYLFTGLLSTAILFPSVSPYWAVAATQPTKDGVAQEETQSTSHTDTDETSTEAPSTENRKTASEKKDISKKTESKTNHKADADKDKEAASSKSDTRTHTSSSNPLASAWDSTVGSTFSPRKNWWEQFFPSTFENTTNTTGNTYPDATHDTSQSHAQRTTSPENRDFFEQLQMLLNDTDAKEREVHPAPTTDEAQTSQPSSTKTSAPSQSEQGAHNSEEQNTSQETPHRETESKTSESQTTLAPSNEEPKQEQSNTHQSKTSTDDTTKQNDALIDSLLDQYSEKARQTENDYRKQKTTSPQNKSAQSTNHDAQITNPDDFKQTREQAPSQSYTADTDSNSMRQTTLFETMPKSDSQLDTSEPMRVVPQSSTRAFINDIAKDAHDIGQKEDVYASIMLAQAILESDSGKSELARAPYYNLFGIKGAYQGESTNFATLESDGEQLYQINADFRKYPDHKASLEDYADLIKHGIDGNPTIYKDVWKSESSSYRTATTTLVGTYATDPQYDEKLQAIIDAYDLTRFDEKEMPALLDENNTETSTQKYSGAFKPFSAPATSPYPHGQCTWYVYHRMAQFDIDIPSDMGNASDWTYSALIKGYSVSSTPKAHTAVVFKPNQLGADRYYGHVAFVEKVNDDGSIVISESNVKGLGVISYRTIDATSAEKLDYISGDLASE